MGHMGCFSFFPSKNLGAYGDGGMVTTSSDDLEEMLKILRVHGAHPKYYHKFVGGNFRLDALQAAVVLVKLPYLEEWTAGRRANAQRYRELFAQAQLDDFVSLPEEEGGRHIYNQFVISVETGRNELREFLKDSHIGTEVYYPVPMHLQACFASLGYGAGDFPMAEQAADQTLALPIYPELTESQQAYVVDTIGAFLNR